jgi:hypothetical protein
MAFDWQRFLDRYQVDYITTGSSVVRGNIAVHCPFCGAADGGHHMGISLEGKGWGCWRRTEHRGRSPVRLVQALLQCGFDEAIRIVGGSVHIPEDFISRVRGAFAPSHDVTTQPLSLELPPAFKQFGSGMPSERRFADYLRRRGFKKPSLLSTRYGLRYCSAGDFLFKDRVIFPIRYEKVLVSWVGRTIHAGHDPRYKVLSRTRKEGDDPDYPLALGRNTDYLLWYDEIVSSDADTLVVVEGPFDALKIMELGHSKGVVATCLFTAGASDDQIGLLHDLVPRFRKSFLLLDRDMLAGTMRLLQRLSGLLISPMYLPMNVKDPGDLTEAQFSSLKWD